MARNKQKRSCTVYCGILDHRKLNVVRAVVVWVFGSYLKVLGYDSERFNLRVFGPM